MNDKLLSQGLELLVYGMGTVVVFLTLLVFATRFMSAVIQRFFPEPLVSAPLRSLKSSGASPVTAKEAPSPELLVVIAAAVHQHRRRAGVSSPSDFVQRKTHV